MRKLFFSAVCLAAFANSVIAQQPGRPPERRDDPRSQQGAANDPETFLNRMLSLDKNKDGKLTKAEVTDARLQALFTRADADKNNEVTKDELTALFQKESASQNQSGQGGRGGPGGGPGGQGGGPGGQGPGGGPGAGRPGERGGAGGPPQPGQILPSFVRDALNLSEAQRQQLDELQKEVDAKLSKILTEEQRRQLQEPRGPRRN